MTDNQPQVDRIEGKLDMLIEYHVDNQVVHSVLETRLTAVELIVDRMAKKFWPMVGALSIIFPIVTGVTAFLVRGAF